MGLQLISNTPVVCLVGRLSLLFSVAGCGWAEAERGDGTQASIRVSENP